MSRRKRFVAGCMLALVAGALFAGVCAASASAGGVVFFVDATHGWESRYHGDGGVSLTPEDADVWRTVDGGGTWKKVATGFPSFTGGGVSGGFFAFATRSTGIWVRAGQKVLRTTNGGRSWRRVGWVARSWLTDASFATKRVGWACSQVGSAADGGSIVKTGNAGRTWRVQKRIAGGAYSGGAFLQVSCPTSRHCYVRGFTYGGGTSFNGIWATADGGRHWARRRLPSGVVSIDFPTARTGWAVASGGAIYKTGNGGKAWRRVQCGTHEDLNSISFCNRRVGYAVGYETVLRTTNGGVTWGAAGRTGWWNYEDLSTVQCVDASHAYVFEQEYGRLYRTRDGGDNWVDVSIFLD